MSEYRVNGYQTKAYLRGDYATPGENNKGTIATIKNLMKTGDTLIAEGACMLNAYIPMGIYKIECWGGNTSAPALIKAHDTAATNITDVKSGGIGGYSYITIDFSKVALNTMESTTTNYRYQMYAPIPLYIDVGSCGKPNAAVNTSTWPYLLYNRNTTHAATYIPKAWKNVYTQWGHAGATSVWLGFLHTSISTMGSGSISKGKTVEGVPYEKLLLVVAGGAGGFVCGTAPNKDGIYKADGGGGYEAPDPSSKGRIADATNLFNVENYYGQTRAQLGGGSTDNAAWAGGGSGFYYGHGEGGCITSTSDPSLYYYGGGGSAYITQQYELINSGGKKGQNPYGVGCCKITAIDVPDGTKKFYFLGSTDGTVSSATKGWGYYQSLTEGYGSGHTIEGLDTSETACIPLVKIKDFGIPEGYILKPRVMASASTSFSTWSAPENGAYFLRTAKANNTVNFQVTDYFLELKSKIKLDLIHNKVYNFRLKGNTSNSIDWTLIFERENIRYHVSNTYSTVNGIQGYPITSDEVDKVLWCWVTHFSSSTISNLTVSDTTTAPEGEYNIILYLRSEEDNIPLSDFKLSLVDNTIVDESYITKEKVSKIENKNNFEITFNEVGSYIVKQFSKKI